MHRFLFRMLLLAGLMVGLGSTGDVTAQSKKKLGGPTVELDGMKSQVYEFWKPQKAESPTLYKFLLPQDLKNDDNAADLTIQETSSKADDVIANWKNSFAPPKFAKNIDEVTRVEKFKVGAADVTMMLCQGTYTAGGKKMDNYRMEGFVFEGKAKKYTIQLVGPFKTVGLHFKDAEGWVKAFK